MKHIYLQANCNNNFFKPKSIQIILLLFLLPLFSYAQLNQELAKEYNQAANTLNIAIGNDQNPVILSAGTNLVGFQDHRVSKFNAKGNLLWRNELNNNEYSLKMDAAGNSYTLGNILSKYSDAGQLLWEYDLEQYGLKDKIIEVDEAGNIYVAGLNNDSEASVLKLNSSGKQVWMESFVALETKITGLVLTIGDEVYLGGTGYSENLEVNVFVLIKLRNSTGDFLLQETYTDPAFSPSHYHLKEILWSESGHIYLVGEDRAVEISHTSLVLLKATTNGKRVWEEKALFEHSDYYAGATLDTEENILLLSHTQFLTGPTGIVTAKYSSSGDLLWSNTYSTGNKYHANPTGIVALHNGSTAVTGSTISEEGNTDLLVLLYNSDGSKAGEDTYGASDTSRDVGTALAADERGNLYVGGYTQQLEYVQETNMLLLKYNVHDDCYKLDIQATGGALSCETNTFQLSTNVVAADALYNWRGPNGFTSDEQNPVVSIPGIYTITVSDPATGCIVSASVRVTPPGQSYDCHIISFDYEENSKGLISAIQTPKGPVAVTGRKRNPDGSYKTGNYAAIFDSQAPTGDDTDLYTRNWGNVLIINQDQTDIPNDNEWGGELILDFSIIGPVIMESMKALDIDSYENNSWVYLYDENGKELYSVQLDNIGNNSKQDVDLGNTKGVMSMKVVFDGQYGDNLSGSGAIDDIKFCIEDPETSCEEAENELDATKTRNAIAYPTPFTDRAIIAFKADITESYVVNLYDVRGNLIRELSKGNAKTGEEYEIEVDGKDLYSGIYIARIISESGSRTVKLLLNKE